MKAAVKVGKERFETRDVPAPEIGPNDCLVRVHYCATCAWCYEEWLRDGVNDLYGPGVTGHEMAGVIERAGEGVTRWRAGDAVLTYAAGHCGECPECREGRETYCRKPMPTVIHGYADYIAVPQQCLLPSPACVDLKHATLISDMVGTSMHAIRRAFAVNLDRGVVAVWGLGPVGLFTVQGVRTFAGVKRVIGLDPVAYRRGLALELGADETLDPTQPDIEEHLRNENGGRGVNYAFNCALRNPDVIDLVFRTLKLDGYLMNVTGQARSGFQAEKRVDGTFYFFKREYDENVRLVLDGKIRLAPVLTHEYPLERINEALELRAKHPDQALKVVIRCVP
ncbi:MAG: alcohol dehydrogenase catalytic domain-containing protein [bacterium]|nr:alcohol dehydrogenase catalytic domain-containing protein [bacterium]